MIRRAFGQVGHVAVPKDEEYLALVRDILENEQVRSMDGYFQHGHTTCLRHSIHVSYLSYLFCKKHGLDARAAARGERRRTTVNTPFCIKANSSTLTSPQPRVLSRQMMPR